MLLWVPGQIAREPEVLPLATAGVQRVTVSLTPLCGSASSPCGKRCNSDVATWGSRVNGIGSRRNLGETSQGCNCLRPGTWKPRKRLSVAAIIVKSALVNVAFDAACLAKVACLLFKWQSQPVVLKTGWVRQLAEWDRQQKIPKKYQDNFFFLNTLPNKQWKQTTTPSSPVHFYSGLHKNFGKPGSYSKCLFPAWCESSGEAGKQNKPVVGFSRVWPLLIGL